MSAAAIQVHGLGKKYQISATQNRTSYRRLTETIVNTLKAPFRRAEGYREFWALRDVSFDVQPGEVLGIIGRNGAGKSTLLKIMSRITEPTEGEIILNGRVGSLLEVGTGFHPELTGRENIFLNGAILGMSRSEVTKKFDEIVAFAELAQFIDTPAKRYSSGMYMRLAFAVAAHLEPEILIVDEVLAVGDTEFQRKCIGKMEDVAKSGRTVLFVSHNMAAIQQLCTAGLVLNQGRITYVGAIQNAITYYMQLSSSATQNIDLQNRMDRQGSGDLRFTGVTVFNREDVPLEIVLCGEDIKIRFYYTSKLVLERATVNIAFNLYNTHGILLTNLNSTDTGENVLSVGQSGYFECVWPTFSFRAGVYICSLFCEINGTIVDWLQAAFQLQVEDGDFFGTGSLVDRAHGEIAIRHNWSSQPTRFTQQTH